MTIYEVPNIISQVGIFNGGVETNVNNPRRTIKSKALLRKENKRMKEKELDELRSLIQARFGNDIEKYAACVGRPAEEIRSFLNGETEMPPGFFDNYVDCASKGMKNVQFGDKYVEIYNRGDNMVNNYAGLMKGAQTEIIRKLKAENTELKKIQKADKELIESLKETIKLLKEKNDR